jgi:hypothetical protein
VDHSRHERTAVNDLLLELRTLLNLKLKDGSITKAQHDAELRYLDQVEHEADTEAGDNGGTLDGEQEQVLTQKLHQAYYTINHNFVP